ncbi:MAG: Gfo/Idh/MocA family oxidoreductase [Planctomycetes bacterium]|nr:Gfo/Idh/MocA family oxidoreductase [Planctomycetota bacterium]
MTHQTPTTSSTTRSSGGMPRRRFLKSLAAAGAGLTILPSGFVTGKEAPSNKLNIAIIGAGGRGRAHFGAAQRENVVALCDVNDKNLAAAARTFSKAEHHVDWRKCLEQKGIDAVICSTTDHTHAFIANWAMNRGMHIYLEKPQGNSVEEVRVVRAKYLKNKSKLATQLGTQRHENPNFDRVREMVRDGAVGTLKHVHVWGDRQIRRKESSYLPAAGDPPPHLHYDLWIGPSPWHPYNPDYFGGCLKWNMFWDFGSGQIGDMGSHTMDLAWNAIDAGLPTSADAHGEPFNPDITPVDLTATFEHPANDWRPAITLTWYQGAHKPARLEDGVNVERIGHGALFVGDKGYLLADFGRNELIPRDKEAGLAHYKPRPKEKQIPPMGGFQQQWIKACKGDLKTSCDFDYSGTAIEQMLLGLVAYRAGKKIEYDGAAGRVTNDAAANDLLSRKYRDGWTLDG